MPKFFESIMADLPSIDDRCVGFSGSYSGDYEEFCLLIASYFHAGFFLDLRFNSEDCGEMIIRNIRLASSELQGCYITND
jgi:hypothetical protein